MRLDVRLILLTFTVILGCSILMSALVFRQFEQSIAPAVSAKVDTLAKSIETEIGTALDYGIPFEKLQGVDEFFDTLNQVHPEIYGIRLYDDRGSLEFVSQGFDDEARSGKALYHQQYPLLHHGKTLSQLEFLIDAKYAEKNRWSYCWML